jgi:hypothetical protein
VRGGWLSVVTVVEAVAEGSIDAVADEAAGDETLTVDVGDGEGDVV